MKKLAAISLVLAMTAASLAGCGSTANTAAPAESEAAETTGGQGQSHGGFFEFLVRHKIRSFRSAHKRYYKLYLYGDKTEQ